MLILVHLIKSNYSQNIDHSSGEVMKTLISTLVLAVSAVMLSVSATAAPHHHHSQVRYVQHDKKSSHHQHKHERYHTHSQRYDRHRYDNYRQFKPTRDWRVGMTIPYRYQSQQYRIDHRHHRLGKPNKNQQWLRINGDYVLVNVKNQKVVRLLRG